MLLNPPHLVSMSTPVSEAMYEPRWTKTGLSPTSIVIMSPGRLAATSTHPPDCGAV